MSDKIIWKKYASISEYSTHPFCLCIDGMDYEHVFYVAYLNDVERAVVSHNEFEEEGGCYWGVTTFETGDGLGGGDLVQAKSVAETMIYHEETFMVREEND